METDHILELKSEATVGELIAEGEEAVRQACQLFLSSHGTCRFTHL